MSLLIKDTTREERAAIVARSFGAECNGCDGCGACGSADMYNDYIEGRKEIAEINAAVRAGTVSDAGPEQVSGRSCPEGY